MKLLIATLLYWADDHDHLRKGWMASLSLVVACYMPNCSPGSAKIITSVKVRAEESAAQLSKTTKLILLDSLLQEVCIQWWAGRVARSEFARAECLSLPVTQTGFLRAEESLITWHDRNEDWQKMALHCAPEGDLVEEYRLYTFSFSHFTKPQYQSFNQLSKRCLMHILSWAGSQPVTFYLGTSKCYFTVYCCQLEPSAHNA